MAGSGRSGALALVVACAAAAGAWACSRHGADAGSPPAAANETSFQKLVDAWTRGKIDEDTFLLYQLYATFDRASLPPEYQGDDSHLHGDATALFGRINERFASMAPDVAAKIQPFLLRPTDDGSFWGAHAMDDASVQSAPGLRPQGNGAPHADYAYLDDAKYPIRIWYVAGAADGRGQAALIRDAIDASGMWDTEKAAMKGRTPCSDAKALQNGGDGRLDVYITRLQTSVNHSSVHQGDLDLTAKSAGVTVDDWSTDTGDPACWHAATILLNSDYVPSVDAGDHASAFAKTTIAHELFHAFQFAFLAKAWRVTWISEATAAWAEDLIYPDANADGEWDYLFSKASIWTKSNPKGDQTAASLVDGPLDTFVWGSDPQYGSYLYFFYLTRGKNLPSTTIGDLWELGEGDMRPSLQVLAGTTDWTDHFKEFALWNWNDDPVKKYSDDGHVIAPLTQAVATPDLVDAAGPKDVAFDLDHASVQYVKLIVDDGNAAGAQDGPFVQSLELDFSEIDAHPELSVQGIVTLAHDDTKRVVKDWSGADRGSRTFCRDRDDEWITSVVFVIANSSADPKARFSGKIHAKPGDACPKVAGTMSYSSTLDLEAIPSTDPSTTTTGHFSYQQTVASDWSLSIAAKSATSTTYTITSKNTISLSGGGSYASKQVVDPIGELSESSCTDDTTGGATSNNPAQPGEFAGSNGYAYTAGSLVATNDGHFSIAWEMAPIAFARTTSSHDASLCTSTGTMETTDARYTTSTRDDHFDYTHCDGSTSSDDRKGTGNPPGVFEASVVGSNLYEGTFDPATGVIDVALGDMVTDCNAAEDLVTHVLLTHPEGVACPDPTSGSFTCTGSWQAHLHLVLPGR